MIRLADLRFAYPGGSAILDGLSCDIGPGLTLLVGPNGCGKSTLLRLLAGIERPDAGTVKVDGLDLWEEEAAARRSLAFVPEYPDVTPYASVGDVVALVARLRGEPPEMVRHALETVGLLELSRRSIRELSLGQRHRVLLAAARIGRPTHLLLDEPLESLDRTVRERTVVWLEDRLTAGASAVVAAHDVEPFLERASRALTLRRGQATLLESLPISPSLRAKVLDELARG